MKNNSIKIDNIEEISEGINQVNSLLKCIYSALEDEFNYSREDVMNLVSVVYDLVKDVQCKLEEID